LVWSFVYLALCSLVQLVVLLCRSERSKELRNLGAGPNRHFETLHGSIPAASTLDNARGWLIGFAGVADEPTHRQCRALVT
jgi:hypothetical protein